MRIVLPLVLIMLLFNAAAQDNNCRTTSFIIKGDIEKELLITSQMLDTFPVFPIADMVITNHKGEERGRAGKMKGTPVTRVLQMASLTQQDARKYSEYCFVFTACDGYKVVYSWNELFNNPTGQTVFFVTEKNGERLTDMKENILVVTSSDYTTGRRYIKGLATITVVKMQ